MALATHFSSDPNTFSSNATEFARSLQTAAEGHALWEPLSIDSHHVIEGDCGYFEGGKFRTLFSVYNPPYLLGLPAILPPQGLDKDVQECRNHNDIIRSSESLSVQVGADLQLPRLPPLSALSIGLSAGRVQEEERSAFLAFGGSKRTVHADRRTRAFENYLLGHCDTIVTHYGQTYPVTVNNIVIVYHTTRCISWWSGISYRSSTSAHGQMDAEFAGVGGGAQVAVSHSYERSWLYKRGPEGWDDETQPGHSIIVRTVALKKSLRARAKRAVRAVTGYFSDSSRFRSEGHGFSPTGQTARTPSTAMSDSATRTPESPDTATTNDDSSIAERTQDTDSESATPSSASDSELIATQYDLLSEALEEALRDNPDIEVVVGNWDTILGLEAQDDGLEGSEHGLGVRLERSGQYLVGRLINRSMETDTPLSLDTGTEGVSLQTGSEVSVSLGKRYRELDKSTPSQHRAWNGNIEFLDESSAMSNPAQTASGTETSRTSVACMYCRKRKIPCDNVRPCHSCTSTGIECVEYAVPTQRSGRRLADSGESSAPPFYTPPQVTEPSSHSTPTPVLDIGKSSKRRRGEGNNGQGDNTGARHKHHIVTACNNCRRMKIRCDGERPCGRCKLHNANCLWTMQIDRRRNPNKDEIEALNARVRYIEDENDQLKGENHLLRQKLQEFGYTHPPRARRSPAPYRPFASASTPASSTFDFSLPNSPLLTPHSTPSDRSSEQIGHEAELLSAEPLPIMVTPGFVPPHYAFSPAAAYIGDRVEAMTFANYTRHTGNAPARRGQYGSFAASPTPVHAAPSSAHSLGAQHQTYTDEPDNSALGPDGYPASPAHPHAHHGSA